MRSWALAITLAATGFLALGFASCEKVGLPNDPPRTYFQPGGAPPGTLVVDNFMFRWFGVDVDSDVRAHYYRVLVGMPCDSVAIDTADSVQWIRVDEPRVLVTFADEETTPDGFYVFQAQTEDEYGEFDEYPLTQCFEVYIQQPPICLITESPRPRQGLSEADYRFEGEKRTRQGDLLQGVNFEYSWQFSQIEPDQEIMYFWSLWSSTEDAHVSGLQGQARYLFQLKVRDALYPEIESEPCRHEFTN